MVSLSFSPSLSSSLPSKSFSLPSTSDDLLLISIGQRSDNFNCFGFANRKVSKSFFAKVSEVERDNEVVRILSCFKLNPYEHLNLPFDSSIEDVKKQYRKISLLVHPDKCKHPKAQEMFSPLLFASYSSFMQFFQDPVLGNLRINPESLMMFTVMKHLQNLGYKIKLYAVEDGEARTMWEKLGGQISILNQERYIHLDWSPYVCLFR